MNINNMQQRHLDESAYTEKGQETQTSSPLLSIVIATRNRVYYAISVIESILALEDPRLELVVQDNSDSRELELYVEKSINDVRFKYRYTPPPLSSIGNFNNALELATGEYVCLIGDDDGVNPEILEAAAWAKAEGFDSLGAKTKVNFLWSGSGVRSTVFTEVKGGALTINDFESKIVKIEIEKEVRNLMRNGGVYYQDFSLPKLYHGLVRRKCLELVRDRTGNYLGGLSPDIYSSLSIACVAKQVAVTDYPLTIPGACAMSTSVIEGAIKQHSKKLEDAPHFRARQGYSWSRLVPRVYTVESIWADSGIAALEAMGRFDLVKEFNLPKLSAFCIARNNGVALQVINHLAHSLRNDEKNIVYGFMLAIYYLIAGPGLLFALRIWNRLLLMTGARKKYTILGLNNMSDVSRALSSHLRKNKNSFKACRERFLHAAKKFEFK